MHSQDKFSEALYESSDKQIIPSPTQCRETVNDLPLVPNRMSDGLCSERLLVVGGPHSCAAHLGVYAIPTTLDHEGLPGLIVSEQGINQPDISVCG